MVKPLCIDLFCGLGGWAEGFLAQGYDVVGFDNHRHEYWAPEAMPEAGDGLKNTKPAEKRGGTAGCAITLGMEGASKRERTQLLRYPGQLVIQDVLTLHGSQFKDAAVIVASPPCQEFSYMAMPWSLAKAKAARIRADETGELRRKLTALFDACFRIQREACEASGRYIPLIVENVKGAQPWVGRAPWNFGSFYLWGDVPALMPINFKRRMKSKISCAPRRFDERKASTPEEAHALHYRMPDGLKNGGGSWFKIGSPGQKETNQNPVHDYAKTGKPGRSFQSVAVEGGKGMSGLRGLSHPGGGGKRDLGGPHDPRRFSSKSSARKMASAQIAKIPFALAEHIARIFKPAYEVAIPRDAATLARDDAPNQTTGAYPAA